MAPNSSHNDARTLACDGGVDRLGDALATEILLYIVFLILSFLPVKFIQAELIAVPKV